ncbi:MAG: hypothetical protein K9L26_02730 [Candidatus Izimaplasma sp.]|nr:hypothetical protein [Candidatus Izimaplasma bacterium]
MMQKIFLGIVLGLLFSTQTIKADVVSFHPVTIITEDCETDIYFDILIDETAYELNDEIATNNFTQFSDLSNLTYLTRSTYVSYSAYHPDAYANLTACYVRFPKVVDNDISTYKLIAFEEDGSILKISDIRYLSEITNTDNIKPGQVNYYSYDTGAEIFTVETHTYPQDTFYANGTFYILLIGAILIIAPGVLWIVKKTKLLQ